MAYVKQVGLQSLEILLAPSAEQDAINVLNKILILA